MNLRETVGLPISFAINVVVFGAPVLAMGFSRFVEPVLFAEPVAEPTYIVYFDPDGMLEGSGEEEAPEDAEPGDPEIVVEAEPPPEPTPEAEQPSAQGEAEEAVEVPQDAPAPTTDAPSDVVGGERSVDEGTVSGKPDAKGEAPPKAGEPGVDATKVKDLGAPDAPKNRTTSCDDPHPQVEKVEEGLWIVQRELIDYYTSSIAVFNTLGWSRKYEDETGEKGWEIGGFGCKSPLWKAGLRSRDVVQLVNGKKTNNVLQIIGIWLGSKKKGDYEVQVLRKGQVLKLKYKVVG
jgi:hypothetical protein